MFITTAHLCLTVFLSSVSQMMLQAGHYDPEAIRSCAEKVAVHWQQLMLKMEDRLKLVNASVAFYKTSEQVCNRSHVLAKYFLSTVITESLTFIVPPGMQCVGEPGAGVPSG